MGVLAAVVLLGWPSFGQQILSTLNGHAAGDAFGQVVDILGDVNGDGYADLMIGAWRDDLGGTDAGTVSVVSGKDFSLIWTIKGSLPMDHMGWGSSAAGDVDGDGFPDIAAAADEADIGALGNAGVVMLVSGKTGLVLHTFAGVAAGDLLGWSCGRVGDVDGDGKDDIIVGALFADAPGKSDCGSATLISGATGLPIFPPFFGDTSQDNFGYSCYGCGDVDNDGVPDFIVGAPGDDNAGSNSGSARLFSGATGAILMTFNGDSANDSFGRSVCGAGDLDQDGFADLIVGAHLDDNNGIDSGSIRVFSGRTLLVMTTLSGDLAGDQLGIWVRGIGDVNGDGYPDFAAGAPGCDTNGSNSGSARVYSGRDFSILATVLGDSPGDALGTSVGGGGDVNQDGFFDLIVGAPGDDNNGSGSGSARVYSLVPPGVFHVGAGTPGCAGPQLLGTNGVPFVGNTTFEIVGNHAPASSLGLLMAADALNPGGWDPFGLGATFYIDFFSMSFIYGWDFPSDAHGSSSLLVPIPNDANIVGLAVTFQSLSAWTTPCGLGPFGVSTSMAAVAFLQP